MPARDRRRRRARARQRRRRRSGASSPLPAAARAAFLVQRGRVIAELEHLAEHGGLAARAPTRGPHFERPLQRGRARVVGVVDDRDALGAAAAPRRDAATAAACAARGDDRRRARHPCRGRPRRAASTFDRLPRPSSGHLRSRAHRRRVISLARVPSSPRSSTSHRADVGALVDGRR